MDKILIEIENGLNILNKSEDLKLSGVVVGSSQNYIDTLGK